MKKSTTILVWGVGTAAVSIIFSQILYATGKEDTGLRWFGILLTFLGIFIGTMMYRNKANGGYLTYGQGFVMGFFMSLIITTLSIISFSIYLHIHPEMIDKIVEAKQTEMVNSGISADELEMRMTMVRKFTTPTSMIVFGFLFFLVVNTILSLITAGLNVRKKPFMQEDDEVQGGGTQS